eukprot:TRINITY_DN2175_c1_g1_i1.p1 TRINITY_DN2175_c1_g1~~TRINITY_DN2175_c1_g1_i1.p1  ORF type:complete len:296 (+),score=67.57 TRINITY_DN2175_c1_g1_i1:233-1120(+)
MSYNQYNYSAYGGAQNPPPYAPSYQPISQYLQYGQQQQPTQTQPSSSQQQPSQPSTNNAQPPSSTRSQNSYYSAISSASYQQPPSSTTQQQQTQPISQQPNLYHQQYHQPYQQYLPPTNTQQPQHYPPYGKPYEYYLQNRNVPQPTPQSTGAQPQGLGFIGGGYIPHQTTDYGDYGRAPEQDESHMQAPTSTRPPLTAQNLHRKRFVQSYSPSPAPSQFSSTFSPPAKVPKTENPEPTTKKSNSVTIYCNECKVPCPGIVAYKTHVEGKKTRKHAQKISSRSCCKRGRVKSSSQH